MSRKFSAFPFTVYSKTFAYMCILRCPSVTKILDYSVIAKEICKRKRVFVVDDAISNTGYVFANVLIRTFKLRRG